MGLFCQLRKKDGTTIGTIKYISDHKIPIDYNEIDPTSDYRIIKTYTENIPKYTNLLNQEYTCAELKKCFDDEDIKEDGIWVILSDCSGIEDMSKLCTSDLRGTIRAITWDMPTMDDMLYLKSIYGKVTMQYIYNNPSAVDRLFTPLFY